MVINFLDVSVKNSKVKGNGRIMWMVFYCCITCEGKHKYSKLVFGKLHNALNSECIQVISKPICFMSWIRNGFQHHIITRIEKYLDATTKLLFWTHFIFYLLKRQNLLPMMIYCINSISQEAEMKENDISTYVKYSHLCENELPTFCKRGLSQNLIWKLT